MHVTTKSSRRLFLHAQSFNYSLYNPYLTASTYTRIPGIIFFAYVMFCWIFTFTLTLISYHYSIFAMNYILYHQIHIFIHMKYTFFMLSIQFFFFYFYLQIQIYIFYFIGNTCFTKSQS